MPWLHLSCTGCVGLQGHGAGMPETGPYPAFQMRHEPLGEVTLESGLRSTWHEIAWLALDNNDRGDGLFVGLLYSGRWSANARAVAEGGASLELFSDGYAMPLPAGETLDQPSEFSRCLSGRSRRRGPRATRVYAGRSHARYAGRFSLGAVQYLVCAPDGHRRDDPAPRSRACRQLGRRSLCDRRRLVGTEPAHQ